MKRLLISVALAGALAGTAAFAQASSDYPPCTSRDQDHCTVGGSMHKAKAHKAKRHAAAAAPAEAAAPAAPAAPAMGADGTTPAPANQVGS